MKTLLTVCGFAIFTAVLTAQQPASQQDLVSKYCLTCHNDKLQTGGLTLEKVDAAHPARDAETWEKVIRKLRAGLMPPSGAPRPDRATLDTFRASIETSIDQAASEKPNPGATALHRLNRTEYANAIRDLLAIDVDVATILPADDSSEGLDNIADVLGTSPALLERYIGAAAKISRLAVGDTDIGAQSVTYKVRGDLTQDDHIPGLPVGTRGGIVIKHNFPVDGEYLFKFSLLKVNFGPEFGGTAKGEQLEMSLNGEAERTPTRLLCPLKFGCRSRQGRKRSWSRSSRGPRRTSMIWFSGSMPPLPTSRREFNSATQRCLICPAWKSSGPTTSWDPETRLAAPGSLYAGRPLRAMSPPARRKSLLRWRAVLIGGR